MVLVFPVHYVTYIGLYSRAKKVTRPGEVMQGCACTRAVLPLYNLQIVPAGTPFRGFKGGKREPG